MDHGLFGGRHKYSTIMIKPPSAPQCPSIAGRSQLPYRQPFIFGQPSPSFLPNVLFLRKNQRPQSCKFLVYLVLIGNLLFTLSQYARITQNHITISFFLFSLIYCCAQCIIQSFLLSVDTQYTTLVSTILKGGNLPPQNFTFLQGRRGHLNLQICDEIPYGSVHPCTTIYDSSLILMPPVKVHPSCLHFKS